MPLAVVAHTLQGKSETPANSLESVALQLKQVPRAAAHSVQQTFENAQHNYKLLGGFIQVRITMCISAPGERPQRVAELFASAVGAARLVES